MNKFNVIIFDINSEKFVLHDVMPYFRKEYKALVNGEWHDEKLPETIDDFKHFIKRVGMYRYWSRTEYEIILLDWPSQKIKKKIDVWYQIENNIDLIARMLMEDVTEL